ncbi:E3 ubiquitin-protein ligase MARCHF11-like [Dermacentor albipictus]|uniref:E3 ubiquitin-protein ligase MARCHF11-like n=1 Tax=Dermacentor albipictus TaxID=60249 RepID=UPI0031FCA297
MAQQSHDHHRRTQVCQYFQGSTSTTFFAVSIRGTGLFHARTLRLASGKETPASTAASGRITTPENAVIPRPSHSRVATRTGSRSGSRAGSPVARCGKSSVEPQAWRPVFGSRGSPTQRAVDAASAEELAYSRGLESGRAPPLQGHRNSQSRNVPGSLSAVASGTSSGGSDVLVPRSSEACASRSNGPVTPSRSRASSRRTSSKVAIVAVSPSETSPTHLRKCSSQRSVQSQKSRSSLTDHLVCRYCFRDDHPEEMVAPCRCIKRSTVRWTHVRCLEEYMNRVHSNKCNLCKKRMAAIIRQKPIWAWFRHKGTRRHQLELALAVVLSVTMLPVLYMAWAYAFFHVAPHVNWAVALLLTPYLIFQTSTWLGFAAYSFWIYYDGMKSWLDTHAVYKFNHENCVLRGREASCSH